MKRFSFPSPYTVVFLVIVLAALGTWLMPAGSYNTLSYDVDRNLLVVDSGDEQHTLPATQETLDQLKVNIKVEKLINQNIRKPVAIPGTYKEVKSNPQGVIAMLLAPIEGIYDAIDVILFVLVIGGFIKVFNSSGAFGAGISLITVKLKGRESWLIVTLTFLFALAGSTFGMAEETLAFFPILIPVFLALGYDVMLPFAVIYAGAAVGVMASTTNPFATIIASDAAGVNWTLGLTGRIGMLIAGSIVCSWYFIRYGNKVKADPSKSILFNKREEVETFVEQKDQRQEDLKMNNRYRILLVLFSTTFMVMIYGVSKLGWWFPEMTALFLVASLIVGIMMKGGEKKIIGIFVSGAKDMVGVAFIIGIARGVTIVLNNGMINDSILNYTSNTVQGTIGAVFIVILMLGYALMTLFIASTSGMAVLTMPIIGSLAEIVGVPREQIVNAYLFGMGIMNFISPAGIILAALAMVKIDFNDWLKFIIPLLGILTLLCSIFLVVGVYL